ncbi:MAG: 50S ribosomal protein L13 [Candidatus Aenigmatarchaeota archaeon]
MVKAIDADGAVLGRLASVVAKELLCGEKVVVVNAGRSVISGKSSSVKERYSKRTRRGSIHKGPFYPKRSDMIMRRAVRGMLPKNKRGRDALKNLRIHVDCPEEYAEAEKTGKGVDDLSCRFMRLGDVAKHLGGKV